MWREVVSELVQPQREPVAAGTVGRWRAQAALLHGQLSRTPRARLIIAHYVLNLGTAGLAVELHHIKARSSKERKAGLWGN